MGTVRFAGRYRDSSLLALCVLAAFTARATSIASPEAPPYEREAFVIGIHGIRDAPSSGWFQTTAALAPSKRRVVVSFDEPEANAARAGAFNEILPRVADGEIVHIGDVNSPRARRILDAIAKTSNATVVVDMHLDGLPLSAIGENSRWQRQTAWAGQIAAYLGRRHAETYPRSEITLVGHSAGTEAVAIAQQLTPRSPQARPVFTRSIALSPRRLSGFTKDTLMVFQDGDFSYSPGGEVPIGQVVGTVNRSTVLGEVDALQLQRQGYAVLRVRAEPALVQPSLAKLLLPALPAHQAIHDLDTPGRTVMVYPQNAGAPVTVPSTALGPLVNVLTEARGTSPAEQQGHLTAERIAAVTAVIKSEAPTDSIGGISLSGTVSIPVAAEAVRGAVYRAAGHAVFLRMKDGRAVRFAAMSPGPLREMYDLVYVKRGKPEVSIGGSTFVAPNGQVVSNRAAPGHEPVYYLGGTRNTRAGLVMYLADVALGKLAFGSTATVLEVTRRVPGFRTLPELFLARYTDHPDLDRYLGEARVFLNPASVRFDRDASGALAASDVRYDIHVPQGGAAENAFASFTADTIDEIAQTNLGAPLADLAGYVGPAALMRWLRDNGVPFDSSELPPASATPYFTPSETEPLRLPVIADIHPALPTVVYGPRGPVRIVRADRRETAIEYRAGRVTAVRRYDGATLSVARDSLGEPVSVRAGNLRAGFAVARGAGLVLTGAAASPAAGDIVLRAETQREQGISSIVSEFVQR